MKSNRDFVLATAMLVLGQTAYAGQPSHSIVVVSYLVDEQSPDRVEQLVTSPAARVLVALPRVSEVTSTTTHGSVNIEVQFEEDATEQDLAAVRQQMEELALDSEVVVTSRTVHLKSPKN